MAEFPVEDDEDVILVEFESRSGLRTVSRGPEELLEESIENSQKAIERAMKYHARHGEEDDENHQGNSHH